MKLYQLKAEETMDVNEEGEGSIFACIAAEADGEASDLHLPQTILKKRLLCTPLSICVKPTMSLADNDDKLGDSNF